MNNLFKHFEGRIAARVVFFSLMLTAVTTFIFSLLSSPAATQAQTAVPTPDRLAAPATVPAPTQADEGAQLYWLHCQPCHGDVGQGLTDAPDDDWRAQYPPEDGSCWESGCHGERPYEDGFTLPKQVPVIIGAGSLAKFDTLEDLHIFMKAAMPFQMPGHLAEAEYLQITAFLARENGVEIAAADKLTLETLATVSLHESYNELLTATDTPQSLVNEVAAPEETQSFPVWVWLSGSLLIIVLVFGGAIWLRYGR